MSRRPRTICLLLGLHAILGQRWLILPLASLWVGGSLAVTIGLTGAFVVWALLVLLADAACALALLSAAASKPLVGVAASIALAATMVLSRSPMFNLQLTIFGVGYVALGGGSALLCNRHDRGRCVAVLYCVWAFIESLFSIAAGFGLNLAARSLLSDEMDVTESEWIWLSSLVGMNYVLCFVSAMLSMLTARSLLRRQALPHGVSESPDSSLGVQLVSHGGDTILTAQVFNSGEKSELPPLRGPAVVSLLAWVLLLLIGTIGFAVTQLDPPGEVMGTHGWLDAPCKGCNCASSTVTCASEGESCQCNGFVQFGRGSEWTQPRRISGSISCSMDAFGSDPLPGVGKYCECQTTTAATPELIAVIKDIRYGENVNRRPKVGKDDSETSIRENKEILHLDLYHSQQWVDSAEPMKSNRTRPAIVVVHGGSFVFGGKNDPFVADEARYFAQHGFVAVSIDYRLAATSFLPELGAIRDAVEDTKAAVRWLKQHSLQYGIDPNRIAVWGGSAGAITAGTIGWVADEGTSSNNTNLSSKVAAAVGISGCLWPFFVDSTDAPSPITGATAVPFFDVHGDQDGRVYPFLAAFTSRYLQHLGVRPSKNRLAIVSGGKHVPWTDKVKTELRPAILTFLADSMPLGPGATCER